MREQKDGGLVPPVFLLLKRKGRQMSWEECQENCPGCRPALLDITTGKTFSDDHPIMIAVNQAWSEMPEEVKRAWHAVTCTNSRKQEDLNLCQRFIARTQELTKE